MTKSENCHESDIYVTRISVIFIHALGFLFLPKNLAPAAGNISNFIFLRGDFIDEQTLKK